VESPITMSPPSLMELASSLEGLDVSPQKRARVKRCTKKRTNRQIFDRDSGNSSQEEEKLVKKKRKNVTGSHTHRVDITKPGEHDVGSVIDALGKPDTLGSSRDVESFDSRFEDMLYADILKAEQFAKESATPPSSLEVSLELKEECDQPQIKVKAASTEQSLKQAAEQADLLYDSCDDMFNMEHVKTPEPASVKPKIEVNNSALDWMFDSPPKNSSPAGEGKASSSTDWASNARMEEVYRIFNDSDS